MSKHQVRCLLMGGQACVLYGAAEFSRDTDLAVLASEENAARLTVAMQDLQAEVVAVPPFLLGYLDAGSGGPPLNCLTARCATCFPFQISCGPKRPSVTKTGP